MQVCIRGGSCVPSAPFTPIFSFHSLCSNKTQESDGIANTSENRVKETKSSFAMSYFPMFSTLVVFLFFYGYQLPGTSSSVFWGLEQP